VTPIEDSTAQAAVILAGDQILQIDNNPVKNLSLALAVNLIRGKAGAFVTILIMRNCFDSLHSFTLKFASITVKRVKYKLLEETIGYLRITSFHSQTSDQVEEALNIMGSRQYKLKGLVIDLRNNPAGLLDHTVKVANKFLDNTLIVSIKRRATRSEITITGKTLGTHTPCTIIILVNRGSASAAEF
jgi:carboxyl-terminal processing protease